MAIWDNNKYYIGCNYWASHAGIKMWQNWDADSVVKDLDLLAEYGMNLLRIFPLWSDFQPLGRVYGWSGTQRDFMQNNQPLQNQAALDETMMQRFSFLCQEADKRGIKILVSLITGWMSGRLFVPPALEGKSLLTDAESLRWQVRYVRAFVGKMRTENAIIGWDLGNECNCLGFVKNNAEAWNWINTITSAIRLEDTSRPVISGMHGLSSNKFANWNLQDQGELLDMVTTHPYPLFTACCNIGEFNNFHSELHSSAESLLYEGISNKPCLVEEAGSLGPLVASEERDAANMRTALYSCLANGMTGYLRWCAFDQDHLDYPPYEHLAMERELGLFKSDRTPKETAKVMKEFAQFLKNKTAKLPSRRIDAVCLVSEREDAWKEAFGAFLLSRQANFDITFSGAEHKLPESERYILNVIGNEPISRSSYLNLLEKVKSGAKLLITMSGESILSPFETISGVKLDARYQKNGSNRVELKGKEITCNYNVMSIAKSSKAEVIAESETGNLMMSVYPYGKGEVYFVNSAIERQEAESGSDNFDNPLYLFYEEFAIRSGIKRNISINSKSVGITEHILEDGQILALLINYAPYEITAEVNYNGDISEVKGGILQNKELTISANNAATIIINLR